MPPRILVLDGNAASRTWAFTPDAEQRVRQATPDGWEVRIMRSATSSDGDGSQRPSDEVLEAIADAEIYVGFGIARMTDRRTMSAETAIGIVLVAAMTLGAVLIHLA